MRVTLCAAALVTVAACGRSVPPARPKPVVAVVEQAASASTADASLPPVASADAGAVSEPAAPCLPLGLAPSFCHRADRERTTGDPLYAEAQEAWFRARHGKAPKRDIDEACFESKVGSPPEDALVCHWMTQPSRGAPSSTRHVYRVLWHRKIFVVRGGQSVTVFERPVQFDMLDSFDFDGTQGPLFAVDFELAPSGTEIALSEVREGACAEAARLTQKQRSEAAGSKSVWDRESGVAWAQFDGELAARICAGVGRYRWKAGMFVLDDGVPRPPSNASF